MIRLEILFLQFSDTKEKVFHELSSVLKMTSWKTRLLKKTFIPGKQLRDEDHD